MSDDSASLAATPPFESSEATPFTPNQTKLAIEDILESFTKWRLWLMLASHDVKLRYRRSALGPFWITLSMAITIYSMGYLYGHLFRADFREYYPFLVGGMLGWSLISMLIFDLSETYVVAEGMIKQIKMPCCLYILRVIARDIIIFFHNVLVILPVIFVFHKTVHLNGYTLLLLPGLLLICLNALTYGLILALIGCRFRDMVQVVRSLVQVIFFMTPIMWNPSILPRDKQWIVTCNPFNAFVELIRRPLIGEPFSWLTFIIVLLVTLIGFSVSFNMLTKYRSRIVYWL